MYYSSNAEEELGFDAFIAPDNFDRTAQPVDIYEVFKREYALSQRARYIYYYSDGNYPLTLTPTADEYYRYGYTQGGVEVMGVDVPLNGTAVTIFNETVTTKRWVIVYRVSSAKFSIVVEPFKSLIWLYCGSKIDTVRYNISFSDTEMGNLLKYIHYSNINTMTSSLFRAFHNPYSRLVGTVIIPETKLEIGNYAFHPSATSISKFFLPNTKNVIISWNLSGEGFSIPPSIIEAGFGASTYLQARQSDYPNLSRISVSPQNTGYASFDYCDIIYTKDLTTIHWIAPKTVRGLYLPDQLPQSQIDALGTKFSLQQLQNHQLYIGTQITDLTNLYLANKSFVTIEVGSGNTAFSVDGNILYNTTKTQLIKAGTYNTGDLIIPNTVTEILANSFLRCSGYIGNLTIPSSVTSIAVNSISGLTNMTSLTLPVGYDTVIYNTFGFANFSADSLNTAILNLADGTAGTPKYFYISETSLDALNIAYPNAVSDAALRFINVRSGIIQDSSLKLWLDASHPLSYPGTGTTWYDLSGNGNNGTMLNGVAPLSNAMQFDGVDDRVTVSTTKFIYQNLPFTLTGWVRVTSFGNPYPTLFSLVSDGGGYWVAISNQSDYLGLYFGAPNTFGRFKTNTPVETFLNKWVYIAVVYNGNGAAVATNFNAYINGLDTPFNAGGPMANNNNGNFIGWRSDNANHSRFRGQINDPLIYNRALTAEEVNQNFQATRNKYGI